jgi:hypothetical protein
MSISLDFFPAGSARARAKGLQIEARPLVNIAHVEIHGSVDALYTHNSEPVLMVAAEDQARLAKVVTRVDGGILYIEREGLISAVRSMRDSRPSLWFALARMFGKSATAVPSPVDPRDDQTPVVLIGLPQAPNVQVNGSGDIYMQEVSQNSLSLTISGSGDIVASGKVDALFAQVNGSGNIDVSLLEAKAARLSVSGSGDIDAYVFDDLDARVNGSGDIQVSGCPATRKMQIRGSGNILIKKE